MSAEGLLRQSFASIEVNDTFTEAMLVLGDGSQLVFRHRVGERWARAVKGPTAGDDCLAEQVLSLISMFRLNAKHLEVQFTDGTRWEARFPGR